MADIKETEVLVEVKEEQKTSPPKAPKKEKVKKEGISNESSLYYFY